MAISIPYAVASAEGLSAEHRETVLELLNNWQSHYSGNVVRSQYYEARNMLKDLVSPFRIRCKASKWPAAGGTNASR